jgi:hypothetical protein
VLPSSTLFTADSLPLHPFLTMNDFGLVDFTDFKLKLKISFLTFSNLNSKQQIFNITVTSAFKTVYITFLQTFMGRSDGTFAF